VHAEAASRGYRFDRTKISRSPPRSRLTVTRAQLEFEWEHLREKLRKRDPERLALLASVERPRPHPLFRVVRGDVASWERTTRSKRT